MWFDEICMNLRVGRALGRLMMDGCMLQPLDGVSKLPDSARSDMASCLLMLCHRSVHALPTLTMYVLVRDAGNLRIG